MGGVINCIAIWYFLFGSPRHTVPLPQRVAASEKAAEALRLQVIRAQEPSLPIALA